MLLLIIVKEMNRARKNLESTATNSSSGGNVAIVIDGSMVTIDGKIITV